MGTLPLKVKVLAHTRTSVTGVHLYRHNYSTLIINIYTSLTILYYLTRMAASRVIVYGGKGALGTVIVDHFKSQNWWVCSIDMRQNEAADENITVDVTAHLPNNRSMSPNKYKQSLMQVKLMQFCVLLGDGQVEMLLQKNL